MVKERVVSVLVGVSSRCNRVRAGIGVRERVRISVRVGVRVRSEYHP